MPCCATPCQAAPLLACRSRMRRCHLHPLKAYPAATFGPSWNPRAGRSSTGRCRTTTSTMALLSVRLSWRTGRSTFEPSEKGSIQPAIELSRTGSWRRQLLKTPRPLSEPLSIHPSHRRRDRNGRAETGRKTRVRRRALAFWRMAATSDCCGHRRARAGLPAHLSLDAVGNGASRLWAGHRGYSERWRPPKADNVNRDASVDHCPS